MKNQERALPKWIRACAAAFVLIGGGVGNAGEPLPTLEAEFAGDFWEPVGAPGRLAEVALKERDYVCLTNGNRSLVGYKTSLIGRYQWLVSMRGLNVQVQEEQAHFTVNWPNGKVVRFTADYSKAGPFVDERCTNLKLRPKQARPVKKPPA